ncbi:MAG: energy-coupling factor transporter transmembrane component T family protein [Paracoccaceae bacterium]
MLAGLHPLGKLAICAAWILASLSVMNLGFQLATLALAVILLRLGGGIPFRRLALIAVPLALFGAGFLITSLLFDRESGYALRMAQEQAAGRVIDLPGLVLFFRVLACGMISAVFVLTTDPGMFIRSLMQTLRLPAGAAFALLHAMHLVPELGQAFVTLRMARSIRTGRPMRRLPGPAELAGLAVPLLAWAIRRAGRAAVAMETRGLAPRARRSSLHPPPDARAADWRFAGLCLAVLIGLVLAFPG